MQEHEIFECLGGVDGIVINDLLEYALYAKYEGADVELTVELGSGRSHIYLDGKEMDALIGFLTYVRSKMMGES